MDKVVSLAVAELGEVSVVKINIDDEVSKSVCDVIDTEDASLIVYSSVDIGDSVLDVSRDEDTIIVVGEENSVVMKSVCNFDVSDTVVCSIRDVAFSFTIDRVVKISSVVSILSVEVVVEISDVTSVVTSGV